MFERIRTGGPYGDESSSYEVEFDRIYTVGELVEEILTKREWGYIGIHKTGEIFGDPQCEYDCDKLTTKPLPKEYLNKTVVRCTAHGGWSRMDYRIYVEE